MHRNRDIINLQIGGKCWINDVYNMASTCSRYKYELGLFMKTARMRICFYLYMPCMHSFSKLFTLKQVQLCSNLVIPRQSLYMKTNT